MPTNRRGLVAPQNTFLEIIIRRYNSLRKYIFIFYLLDGSTKANFGSA